MIIDITHLVIGKGRGLNWIANWLHRNVGEYIGPGEGLPSNISGEHAVNLDLIRVVDIGQGWQIEVHTYVDSYGRTIQYKLDITDDKMATFFILKFS
jgi:hypothetical protein